MRHKWIAASILIVALIVVCGASLFATWQGIQLARGATRGIRFTGLSPDQISVKSKQEKTIAVDQPISLSVKTFQGNITVKTGKEGQVNVKSDITAWGNSEADAQAALKDITVVIDQTDQEVNVSVDQAVVVDMLHIGPRGGRVNFTITVPPDTAVKLNSVTGDLSLSGTTGDADLETEFGSLGLSDISGNVSAKSGNGKITAQKIKAKGTITLSSEFGGTVVVEDIQGTDITISSSNGQLSGMKNIRASGLLKIKNSFGDIRLEDAQAKSADIRSNNGTIDLERITVENDIIVRSDFGSLSLQEVTAKSYDLKTKNGKINMDGGENEIIAHSDFGSVTILNAKDATLDLSSKNGAVSFSGSLGNGPHTLHSDFGNIKVTLPSDSAFDLDLETDFGKITSSFSITMNGSEMDSQHWHGTVNGGGASLAIDTKNGNITLSSK